MKNFIIKSKIFKFLWVLFFWLIVWQIFYMLVNQEIFLVSPFSVLHRVFVLSLDYNFWLCIFFSLFRVILGFILAIFIGTSLAIVMYLSHYLCCIFKPLILIIKTMPVASFVILVLVFIKSFYLPIFISFLMVMPVIWSNIFEGMSKVDCKLLQMSSIYQFSKASKIKYIYYPSLKPYFLAAVTTGVGFAWKSVIAAEVIANTTISIGEQVLNSKLYMETLDVFAWTVVITLLSFILERILVKCIKKILN